MQGRVRVGEAGAALPCLEELAQAAPSPLSSPSDMVGEMGPIEVREAQRRLEAAGGGYEIVHESPGLELGVYVLVAPEPDRQQPHEDDELYVVLEGRGTLDV